MSACLPVGLPACIVDLECPLLLSRASRRSQADCGERPHVTGVTTSTPSVSGCSEASKLLRACRVVPVSVAWDGSTLMGHTPQIAHRRANASHLAILIDDASQLTAGPLQSQRRICLSVSMRLEQATAQPSTVPPNGPGPENGSEVDKHVLGAGVKLPRAWQGAFSFREVDRAVTNLRSAWLRQRLT